MKYLYYISICLISATPHKSFGQWTYLNTGETRHLYHLEVFGEDTILSFGNSGAFIYSFDGGQSWSNNTVPNIGNIYNSAFINKYTGLVLDVAGNMNFTTDGGLNWQVVMPIPGSPDIYDVELSSDTTIMITSFGSSSGILYTSNDWGTIWNSDTIPLYATEIEILNDSTWILGGPDFTLFKTTDRGVNWQNVFLGNSWSDLEYLVSSDDSTIYGIGCYLNCDYCDLHSIDQGNTWVNTHAYTGSNLYFFKNGSGSFIGLCNPSNPIGGQYLAYSADTGHTSYTSHHVTGDTLLINIKYANELVGYVCGWYGTVLKTTIGGATAINEIDTPEFAIFPNPFSDYINVTNNSNEIFKFKLFDESARNLLKSIISSEVSLNTSNLEPGIYFYTAVNEKGNITNGKIIKLE